jgi:N-acetylmuramoyl-L-alanine amidase
MIRTLSILVALCAAMPAASAQTRTIVIDPGHGGSDPGGTGNGLQEKNIVLDVGRRFKQLLDADTADPGGGGSWRALLTRSDDTFVSLSARAAFANAEDADRFMSIHSNAFSNSQANGTETFSFREGTTGASMRNLVQAEMIAAWGRTNRGNKTANFAVLRETAMPAELHELAFITNAGDAAFLASATQRQIAAQAHLRAIQRHFGVAPFVPSSTGEAAGQVVGRVVADGQPVAGARVVLDEAQETATAADGGFSFAEVAPGTHSLTVSADGFQELAVDIEVTAGAASQTEITLESIEASGDGGESEDDGTAGDDGDDGSTGDDGPAPGEPDRSESGCASGSRSAAPGGLLLALGLAVLLYRRRRG